MCEASAQTSRGILAIEPRHSFVEITGARLYCEWQRPAVPGTPVLVFLHDGLGSIETWRTFPRLLADRLGLGAFAYDRWGYGRSQERSVFPDWLMADAAERFPKVLSTAGIDDYVVIGHSDGGTIALLHAAANPAGLRAVVSIAAHIHGDDATTRQLIRLKACLDKDDIPEWVAQFHGAKGRALLTGWVSTWSRAMALSWDIEAKIASIVQPLMAIHGTNDEYGLNGQLEGIGRAVPHAKTVLLPGAGHFPHLADPGEIVTIVAEFLAAELV